jgi:hypothetical protein
MLPPPLFGPVAPVVPLVVTEAGLEVARHEVAGRQVERQLLGELSRQAQDAL